MAGTGIGRDQERRTRHASLGKSNAERLVGQADNSWMAGFASDLASGFAFVRAAQDQNRLSGFFREPPRQCGEMSRGPVFGRPERARRC